ncbi:TetR/AcrR family transcriptional regulator [Actinomadura sp. CNU-125]|uniref:TetR/AcrR family transcriptional regulator n=1 Tax=Actinomadura sp. CNU-125 TaxID=1904961 RepID=UPI0021CC8EC2|nr:TetR family transcriptional regulator [Actinomadura sp. CNU-125]
MSERTTSSARGDETREHVLDAAERLIAERGVTGVSLNEINGAAGQRNTAALRYHFGGRDGLVRAIMRRYGTRLRERHAVPSLSVAISPAGGSARPRRARPAAARLRKPSATSTRAMRTFRIGSDTWLAVT